MAQPAGTAATFQATYPGHAAVTLTWSDDDGVWFEETPEEEIQGLTLEQLDSESYRFRIAASAESFSGQATASLTGAFGAWTSFVDGEGDFPLTDLDPGQWIVAGCAANFSAGSGAFTTTAPASSSHRTFAAKSFLLGL